MGASSRGSKTKAVLQKRDIFPFLKDIPELLGLVSGFHVAKWVFGQHYAEYYCLSETTKEREAISNDDLG